MDAKPMELQPRGTGFKDAVLDAAEARKVQIITEAQQESSHQLNEAQQHCQQADHSAVATRYDQDTRRQHSAQLQAARRGLLARRSQLVDALFGEVEQRLAAFTQGEAYPEWLAARLAAHADAVEKTGLTVWLRPGDKAAQAAAQKVFPGCDIKPDEDIRLGGVRFGAANLLFDETLDSALAAQREQFYEHSGLIL